LLRFKGCAAIVEQQASVALFLPSFETKMAWAKRLVHVVQNMDGVKTRIGSLCTHISQFLRHYY